jgi:hypothetical protein
MFIETVMGSWLVLWAGVFAPAWPGRRMRCRCVILFGVARGL